MRRFLLAFTLLIVASGFSRTFTPTLARMAVQAQAPFDVEAVARDRAVARAIEVARSTESQTVDDQIRFCETAAPPFHEAARADLLKRAFDQLGLRNVRVDRVGNVLGDRPGVSDRPHVVVAAHLDTVFPPETDVRVKRSGSRLIGPGIGDNCRGLAVLVAIVRSMREAGVSTPGSITFVANVGEEGLGDLRGVRELFGVGMTSGVSGRPARQSDIDRFVSIDGPGISVTNVAVGSHRYRVTFKGPGGHSFAAFGTANPVGAMGRAIARISELRVSDEPRTTFNVGRIGGGTSVNAIPADAWMEVDLRSSDTASLASLDAKLQDAIDRAVLEENARWGRPGVVTASKDRVGDRPAGSTPASSAIVQAGLAAARVLGVSPSLGEGSTDANLPMQLGIPAITIGGGGAGADAHTLAESFDTSGAWKGTQHALLVTIVLAR